MKSIFWLKLRVIQSRHLEKESKCGLQSFYECFANLIKSSEFKNRTKKCLPESLWRLGSIGNVDISDVPLCQNEEERKDSWDHLYFDLLNNNEECPESCISREYTGKVDYEQPKVDTHKFEMMIRFARPFKMTTFEEYLLYDFGEMVGTVGGTLGLFIGFSFYDVILKITNYLNMLRN